MSNSSSLGRDSMETIPEGSAKYVKIAGEDLEIPRPVVRRRPRPWEEKYRRDHEAFMSRDVASQLTSTDDLLLVTLTKTHYSTITRSTMLTTSTTVDPLNPMISASQTGDPTTTPASTFATVPQASSTSIMAPASATTLPTAVVAALSTLIPLSFMIAIGFYFYFRRRHRGSDASISSLAKDKDKYVWGPLGLIKRRDRDKMNPVLKAQEAEARVDPIAEAIRQEEQERLAKMRRSGEARFYAPGVRHLVEYVGSRERMKVIIDWRDKVKMERPW